MRELVVPYIPDSGEFEKAAARLTANADAHGGNEPAALAWLLEFLQADVPSFSGGQLDDRVWEALRFIADSGQTKKDYGQAGLYFQPPATRESKMVTLLNLQAETIEVVKQYLSTGVADFPTGEGKFKIARGYHSVIFGSLSLNAGFYFMAAQLLARYGDHIKACEGCSKLMLIGRKDKRFHSPTCRITDFIRKKRAKTKAELLAQQQMEKKKRRAKHGKKR